jgi:hypothetical protein
MIALHTNTKTQIPAAKLIIAVLAACNSACYRYHCNMKTGKPGTLHAYTLSNL